MPGITGFIKKVPMESRDRDVLAGMVGCMRHEPFYTFGTVVRADMNVGVGWTGLKDSFSDCMPVWSDGHDICLVFSGEDFSESDRGPDGVDPSPTHDGSNARYLVDRYRHAPARFLRELNGWFSGVLLDLRTQQGLLFNDRYGLGRIYYHENAEGLYFSSEAKSILKALPHLRQLDMQGLAESFSCGCVLQNRSLFAGISLLPGGAAWQFGPGGNVVKSHYFTPAQAANVTPLSPQAFTDRLRDVFPRVLARYLRANGRVGMSITGGLDTRAIMAWAPGAPEAMPCYTFGGTYRECADVRIGRRVAKMCHQEHVVIPLAERFLAAFPTLAEKSVYLSDGAMDVTGAAELYANRMARDIAPVRLTGNYGDEILRGHVAFRPSAPVGNWLTPDFTRAIEAAARTYASERIGNGVASIAFKQVPWHHYARFALEQSQLTLRSPFLDTQLLELATRMPPALIGDPTPALDLIHHGNPRLGRIETDRGLRYAPIPGLTRLHHLWQEFKVRAEYAYDYGMPQALARIDGRLKPLHLETLFLGAQKFTHFRVWYRDVLATYVRDVLLDPRALNRPYLQRAHVERMVEAHLAGTGNFTSQIHRLLTTELLQRTLIES